MDNDFYIKKQLAKIYKTISYKIQFYDKKVINSYESNRLISGMINENNPCMVSRFGATELLCINSYLNGKGYNKTVKYRIKNHAGVFPDTDEILDKFSEIYIESIRNIDILAVWGIKSEKKIINKFCKKDIKLINPRGLEPYYFNEEGWSRLLDNKKVLVIHPFKKSILKQYEIRESIFEMKNILPEFKSLQVIEAVQSIAGECNDFNNWLDAYSYMCNKIDSIDFDIAIIGAGAYGLPLCSYVKSKGKKAIHMGGATQILFGIKGMRWDNHKFISSLYNESWKRPYEQEVPVQYKKVEGGSYW